MPVCLKYPALRIVKVSPGRWSASFGTPSIFSSTSYKTPLIIIAETSQPDLNQLVNSIK